MIDIYYVLLEDDDLGLECISIVDKPAIKRDFVCLADDNKMNTELKLSDDMKHCIFGPAIIPDMPISRINNYGEPYYIVFTKDVIEKMVDRFSQNQFNNLVDLQHNGKFVDGVIMNEIFIKDTNKGLNPTGYEDLPNGTLFVQYKITDEVLWNKIMNSGNLNGFSIQAQITRSVSKFSEQDEDLTQDYL